MQEINSYGDKYLPYRGPLFVWFREQCCRCNTPEALYSVILNYSEAKELYRYLGDFLESQHLIRDIIPDVMSWPPQYEEYFADEICRIATPLVRYINESHGNPDDLVAINEYQELLLRLRKIKDAYARQVINDMCGKSKEERDILLEPYKNDYYGGFGNDDDSHINDWNPHKPNG